ncbi:MAG: glycoside hydrolase family 127 protein, partial [Fermentimonas sp.]|nr:glycoside hydrolase family 127 protein [Fermentimonas sp.]
FPLYLRIPTWSDNPTITVNGIKLQTSLEEGKYACIEREWQNGDEVVFDMPMKLTQSVWQVNQDSRSINYGPLTFSLKIKENYEKVSSIETAIGDSKWQKNADQEKWPSYEIYPASDWNYALELDDTLPLESNFEVVKTTWPADDFPFSTESAPIHIKAKGRKVPDWKIDQYGLTSELPIKEEVKFEQQSENITLIPMGAARLRISAFPVYIRNIQ